MYAFNEFVAKFIKDFRINDDRAKQFSDKVLKKVSREVFTSIPHGGGRLMGQRKDGSDMIWCDVKQFYLENTQYHRNPIVSD